MNNSTDNSQKISIKVQQLTDKEFAELSVEKQYKYLQENFSNTNIDWNYKHNVVICERSKTVVEPLISQEFFVDYYKEFEHSPIVSPEILAKVKTKNNSKNKVQKTKTTLQKLALEGIEEVEFLPIEYQERATKYFDEIKNWCISRDLIWGHKMPVWYNLDYNFDRKFYTFLEFEKNEIVLEIEDSATNSNNSNNILDKSEKSATNQTIESQNQIQNKIQIRVKDCFQISPTKPEKVGNWIQETKILDTWFSSTLWPLSTLDFPKFVQKAQKITEIESEIETLEQMMSKIN